MYGAPEWVPRSVVTLLAIGFIPVLIFSWIFELTPEGLKRDADVAPEHSIGPQTARRLDRMIIVILLIALGLLAFDKFVLTSRREAKQRGHKLLPILRLTRPHLRISAKSIAVLPFESLSSDKENAYFADGVQDEILTNLAKVADFESH
jgi:hypothetical protein